MSEREKTVNSLDHSATVIGHKNEYSDHNNWTIEL
jgi:hypothetical protein